MTDKQATKKPAAAKTAKAKAAPGKTKAEAATGKKAVKPSQRAAEAAKAVKTRTVTVVNAQGSDKPQGGARTGPGRPSLYKPEYADLAFKFALLGANDEKLASFFNVCEATLNNWKLEHPEFLESLTRGKDRADAEVAHSLYHRALGYSHKEDDIKAVALGNNMGSEIVITPTIKHYPPDTGAATLWLKNRQKHLWRDKVDVAHENPDGSPLDMSLKVSFVTPGSKG